MNAVMKNAREMNVMLKMQRLLKCKELVNARMMQNYTMEGDAEMKNAREMNSMLRMPRFLRYRVSKCRNADKCQNEMR